MTRLARVLSWILLLSTGVAAWAADNHEQACSVQSVSIEGQSGLVYYPFADRDEVGRLRLIIAARGQCRFGLALLPTSSAELLGPGQPVSVTFRDMSDRILPMNGNEQRWLRFEQTARGAEVDIALLLPRGQARRAGDYANNFVARIFANGHPVREIDFPFSIRVAPQVDLRLAGNTKGQLGKSAGMNFGRLETGESLSALLAVRANGAYNLTVTSDNHGQLRHTSLSGDNTAVPYTAWLDGQQLSLHGGGDSRSYSTPHDGKHFRSITVQIGDTRGRVAGDYGDCLRATITTLQ
ncbi:hypothetical protein [Microbulbifer magnicolonia]|uniref:hypothetical protein n=1 Tax=Microbulbifer magnicolonia TaxID=3109744 RepID=UPI002B4160CE|nr:hypothetical protein [Microbulbifer sp. GG15]